MVLEAAVPSVPHSLMDHWHLVSASLYPFSQLLLTQYAQDLELPSDHIILLAYYLLLHNQLTQCLNPQILREKSKMSSSSFLIRSCVGLWLTNRIASCGSGVHCWFSHLRLRVELGSYDTEDSFF